MGNNITASNISNTVSSQSSKIINDFALNSSTTCNASNVINIEKGCEMTNTDINQKATCTINNSGAMDNNIKNSIKQISKQNIAQTAQAIGQNISFNPGDITSENISNMASTQNQSMVNVVDSSCMSNLSASNTLDCKGKMINAHVNQDAAANSMQKCTQDNTATNMADQTISQIVSQKAKAVQEDALGTILFGIAAIIFSCGLVIKFLPLNSTGLETALMIVILIAVIAFIGFIGWQTVMLAFHNDSIAQNFDTDGDQCPDLSKYGHNPERFDRSPNAHNERWYKSAIKCVGSGGTWYNEEGYPTKGYSDKVGKTGSIEGVNGWNPDLLTAGNVRGQIGDPQCVFPKIFTRSHGKSYDETDQCYSVNKDITKDIEENKFNYKTYKDKCIQNKCLWLPSQMELENDKKDGLSNYDTTTKQIDIIPLLNEGLFDYSYKTLFGLDNDDGVFNSPSHLKYTPLKSISPVVLREFIKEPKSTTFTDDFVGKNIIPIFLRYDVNTPTDVTQFRTKMDSMKDNPTLKVNIDGPGINYYTLYPFCTGNRTNEYECSKSNVNSPANL